MTWQLLTFISAFTLSGAVLLQRSLLSTYKVNVFGYAVFSQFLIAAVLFVPALALEFKLPNIENYIVESIVAIVAFGAGHILYAKALQLVEASRFSVLFATQAIWIMGFGIVLFGESLTIAQIVGTLFIFISVLLLSGYWQLWKVDKGTVYGLITAFIFAIAITSWSYVGRGTDGLSWTAVSFAGTAIVAFLLYPRSIILMKPFLPRKILVRFILLAIVYAIGSYAMLGAYTYGDFSTVTPLRQTSIIITVLMAFLFFKNERTNIKLKLTAALISFVGVILIVL